MYLEGLYEVYSIQIHWEAAYSSSFELSVSTDSLNWTTVITENNGNGGKDSFNIQKEARYLRFVGHERATEWGHSFYEFEAFGRLIEADPNSINEFPKVPAIKLYPNPGYRDIKISGLDSDEEIVATISNTSGQLVKRIHLGTDRLVDISNIKPGLYFIFLDGGSIDVSLKFIKMNH